MAAANAASWAADELAGKQKAEEEADEADVEIEEEERNAASAPGGGGGIWDGGEQKDALMAAAATAATAFAAICAGWNNGIEGDGAQGMVEPAATDGDGSSGMALPRNDASSADGNYKNKKISQMDEWMGMRTNEPLVEVEAIIMPLYAVAVRHRVFCCCCSTICVVPRPPLLLLSYSDFHSVHQARAVVFLLLAAKHFAALALGLPAAHLQLVSLNKLMMNLLRCSQALMLMLPPPAVALLSPPLTCPLVSCAFCFVFAAVAVVVSRPHPSALLYPAIPI